MRLLSLEGGIWRQMCWEGVQNMGHKKMAIRHQATRSEEERLSHSPHKELRLLTFESCSFSLHHYETMSVVEGFQLLGTLLWCIWPTQPLILPARRAGEETKSQLLGVLMWSWWHCPQWCSWELQRLKLLVSINLYHKSKLATKEVADGHCGKLRLDRTGFQGQGRTRKLIFRWM